MTFLTRPTFMVVLHSQIFLYSTGKRLAAQIISLVKEKRKTNVLDYIFEPITNILSGTKPGIGARWHPVSRTTLVMAFEQKAGEHQSQ